MSGRNLYERVRAAYGLEDDDDLRDLSASSSAHRTAGRGMSGGPAASLASTWSIVNSHSLTSSSIDPRAPSYRPPAFGARKMAVPSPQPLPSLPSPPPQPHLEPTALEKVNSVRVPFDPDDQSDDEVIITTAYKRKVRTGESIPPPAAALEQPPQPSYGGSTEHQYTTKHKNLSPTAAPFQPHSGSNRAGHAAQDASAGASEPRQPPKPLVDIVGANGTPNDAAKVGCSYPGSRTSFCPWALVANYHMWFVGRQNSERIKPYFENAALLQAQDWDFCYLWRPARDDEGKQQEATSNTPRGYVLLVPTSQFQHFMNRINQTLGIQLIIPPGPSGEKFRVFFGQQKTPIPRFLGRARDKTTFASIVRSMPAFDHRDGTEWMKPQAKKMYEKKIAGLVLSYDKDKLDRKNAKAEKLRLKRTAERQRVGRQIKRVQRYLGLRQKGGRDRPSSLGALDLTKPPPYAPEGDVIFVSMDIESYEYNHGALTEIGFGILDTRDVAGIAPGAQCEHWFKLIQARHIRIREHASMVNRNFVRGCEDSFNFGASEFVKLGDVLDVVTRILQPSLASGERRKVVLLGHDTKSDISLIEKVGFFVKDDMFLEILDTQDIHQHFRMRSQQMGLRGVLNDLEIEHSFLHNGGNDAVYTLQAMVALIVKKRQDSLRRQNERAQPSFAVDAEVLAQGWASGGEGSDGGYPEKGAKDSESAAEEAAAGPGSPKPRKQATARLDRPLPKSAAAARSSGPVMDRTTYDDDAVPRLGKNLSTIALGDNCEDLINL